MPVKSFAETFSDNKQMIITEKMYFGDDAIFNYYFKILCKVRHFTIFVKYLIASTASTTCYVSTIYTNSIFLKIGEMHYCGGKCIGRYRRINK